LEQWDASGPEGRFERSGPFQICRPLPDRPMNGGGLAEASQHEQDQHDDEDDTENAHPK
jgi:hypothetical protein